MIGPPLELWWCSSTPGAQVSGDTAEVFVSPLRPENFRVGLDSKLTADKEPLTP